MKSNLFWITGLSGSGKTTFAKKLVEKLELKKERTVLIDGDVIREIFDNESDYSKEARLKTAYHYSKLSKFLVKQNLNVVCSTISLFHEIQKWNRKNISNYIEIFVKVEMAELIKRDSKKIYSKALNGELKNVVGIDIKPEFPNNPNLILDNISEDELEAYASRAIALSRQHTL